MNNIVFVLIVLANNGHFANTVVPTLEFKTREACERAISTFKNESENREGTVRMRCVGIEK